MEINFAELSVTVAGLAVTFSAASFLVKTLVVSGIQEAVKANFAERLEDYKSAITAQIERLKSSLKNTEHVFVKQLEALTQLRTVLRQLIPRPRAPDQEWDEAAEEIVLDAVATSQKIDDFLCKYGAILPKDVLSIVDQAVRTSTDCQFEVRKDPGQKNFSVTPDGIEKAGELYELIRKAVDLLQETFDKQIEGIPSADK